jgi:hypothetical protein
MEKDPTIADEPPGELQDGDQAKIQEALTEKSGEKLSIQQCNEDIYDDIETLLRENQIIRRKIKEPRMFAETNFVDNKVRISLSNLFMDQFSDKNIPEVEKMLEKMPSQITFEMVNRRYEHGGEHLSFEEYGNLKVFPRILVHELGHVYQFKTMLNPLGRIMPGLASKMSKKDQFPSVPKKMKESLQNEILEPMMTAFEYSAESFFVDAIPCVL